MERIEIGRAPISPENPAGEDVRYEPDFETLSEEINKLSSPTADPIDWSNVVSLGEKILRDQSKNLTVCCYLSIGLLHAEGLRGLADGLRIMHDLFDEYWESMYPLPKRKKARINILDWWNDKLKAFLEGASAELFEPAAKEAMLADIGGIDSMLADRLDEGPDLRSLQEKLDELLTTGENDAAPEPADKQPDLAGNDFRQTEPAARKEETAPPRTVHSMPPAAAGEADAEDAHLFFKKGLGYLSTSANLFFNRDTSDYLAYRLNRIIAWFEIDSPPPATDGKTMLEPPDRQLQTLLSGLYEAGSWEELLQAAESRIRQYLFWLDLDFWVFTALTNLGFTVAARSVMDDTLLFVSRLKGLDSSAFADGTPFAGEDTRAWLESGSSPGESGGVAMAIPPSASGQEIADDIQAALQLADEKGQQAMLSYVQDKIACTPSVNGQFAFYLALCQILMRQKQSPVLQPFVDKMMTLVDRYKLEQWDPELAVQAMTIAYACLNKADRKKNGEQLRQLFGRITLLNAQKSLEIL